jgi:hypothetical protein
LRVRDHEAEHPRAFEEVRDAVAAAYALKQGRQLAAEAGESALASLRDGATTLASVADDQGWELIEAGWVGRGSSELPLELTRAVFNMARPGTDAGYLGLALAGGDYAIARLNGVRDGEVADSDQTRELEALQLARIRGEADLENLTDSLRARSDIELE